MRTTIVIKDIQLKAFHGVLPQERTVGGDFVVNVRVDYPFSPAMQSDSVEHTLNYADLYRLVHREMAVPSQLLEHVAGRILHAIRTEFPEAGRVELSVTKLNPPMGGQCAGAGVELVDG
ncbi:MAG: dihydroneopterin aldolase [Prevotella sp.]